MPVEPAVRIEGLNEFVRGIKHMDRELPKAVRKAFNEAADVVVNDAVPRIPSRSGRAAGSVKSRSTQRQARVAGGGNKVSYYPWLDFGGRVGKGKSVSRPFMKEGRYIYRSYFEAKTSGEFEKVMVAALLGVAESAGIKVEKGV